VTAQPPPEPDVVHGQLVAFARDLKSLYRQERERARELEEALERLSDSYLSTMESLAVLVEAKDENTRRHLDRSMQLALELTRLVEPGLAERPEIGWGYRLHDIGKVAIAERILLKRGELTPSEWLEMRTHPEVGAQIVAPLRFLGDAVVVIRHHHERFDGSGYPHGLDGEAIPTPARIFSVVDAFDAITNDRPYRKARPPEDALEEIARRAGSQFDPFVVEAFVQMVQDRRQADPPAATFQPTVSSAPTRGHAR
jgi:HD-GYP domain-containing protein (c-di-GMP phosphodiesterase class II)